MQWTWWRILSVACVALVVGIYVGESKRLVVNIQDCVKYRERGTDEGFWHDVWRHD